MSGYENIVDAVISSITRHPMRQDELERALNRWSPRQVRLSLEELEASGRTQIVNRNGVNFWSASSSHYPDDEQSTQTIPEIHRLLPKDGA